MTVGAVSAEAIPVSFRGHVHANPDGLCRLDLSSCGNSDDFVTLTSMGGLTVAGTQKDEAP